MVKVGCALVQIRLVFRPGTNVKSRPSESAVCRADSDSQHSAACALVDVEGMPVGVSVLNQNMHLDSKCSEQL